MNKSKIIFLSISLSFILNGCANSINYYHKERNGITLEASSSDPQQPLQGNIGVKVRTIVVAPGKQNAIPLTTNPGDSTSFISDFYMNREPDALFGKTTIKSAFITGDAAIVAPAESAKALSGLGVGDIGELSQSKLQTMRKIFEQIQTMANAKDKKAVTYLERLNGLSKFLPDISSNTYYKLPTVNGDTQELQEQKVTLSEDFKGVLKYANTIAATINNVILTENDRTVQYKGKIIDPTTMEAIKKVKSRVEKERAEFFAKIGNSHIIDAAAAYVVSTL